MSNYAAITGSSKIVHRNQGGGSKLQGIPSSTNLNTWAHVAFRNRNVVCPCNRDVIFCMNQLGGVGAGGIPGRSYAFAPTADGTHKPFYCGHRFGVKYGNNKHLIIPKTKKIDINLGGVIVSPFVDIITNKINLYDTYNDYPPIQRDGTYRLYIPLVNGSGNGIELKQGQIYVYRAKNTFYAVTAMSYNSYNDNIVEMTYIGKNPTYVNKLKEDILYIAD